MNRNTRDFFIAMILLSLFVFSQTVRGDVITVETVTSDKDRIYVAGNPDFYPIEYYDELDDAYKGVMPRLLSRISETMGVDFAYVSAGKTDKRVQLASNGQVELVSAVIKDGNHINDMDIAYSSVPIRYESDHGVIEVCFAFSSIATKEFKKSFEEALTSIPEAEVLQIALGQTMGAQTQGIPVWLFICVSAMAFLALVILFVAGILLHKKRKLLKYVKWVDEATGLGNKAYFIHTFNEVIEDAARPIYAVAFIGFDIAKVNNRYSYDEAEEQLRFTAKELKDLATEGDIVARVGGGNFVVAHACQTGEIGEWISRVLERLNRYCDKFNRNYRPEFHAGVYMIKKTDDQGELVIDNAQQGYEYAVSNSISYAISNDALLTKVSEDKQLIKYTTSAVENGEIRVYVQLVQNAEGSVMGGEVLARWQHPSKGLVLPSSFIPIMENGGTLGELDYYIFEQTCILLEKWQLKGYDYTLSCNFNRISISSAQFINRIGEIVSKYDFNRENLIIEITESTKNVNKKMAFFNLSKCKALGFQIGLDDVGSGHISFSDLKEFPMDIIKVDQSIVAGATNAKGIALLKSIITLTHKLGMLVLCEGIETERQYLLLKSLQCDYYQGYYFYRQMPVEEVEKIIL